jgi:hypothetical protein
VTRPELCAAIAGLARTMTRNHEACADLVDSFLLLTEVLVAISPPVSRKQAAVQKLVDIELALSERAAVDRIRTVMRSLGISRSYYFELRAAAIEQRLLESTNAAGSRTASEPASMDA